MADQPQQKLYVITEQLLAVTRNYLLTRPMNEVRTLVEAFEKALPHSSVSVEQKPSLTAVPTTTTSQSESATGN